MIVYTKVLIAAINLMKMTGPIKAEMNVLDVITGTGTTWVIVPGKLLDSPKGARVCSGTQEKAMLLFKWILQNQ